MPDQDTGDFDGLPPDEATDSDERDENDEEYTDPPDDWVAADRYGVTHREESEGSPLSLRLTEELPDDAVADLDNEPQDTPLGENLHIIDDQS